MIIKGNTVGTTMPRSNWDQIDPKKADYIKGKEAVDAAIQNAQAAANNAQAAANNAQTTADQHSANKNNPHSVTAAQVGARPDTWMPTAADVGAVTETQVTTMINDALGVIENGTY